ncbi:MAG: hypothetical protein N3C57_01630, partial [Aquificaceae bacterium]|nr:hypothetical protein [Aquificaceae bacterium]
ERLQEDIRNNPTVLACGYVNGKLLYIIAFTFECIKSKMENLLKRRFGEEMRRRRGEYLRSASFSFRDYRDCCTLKVVYAYENIEYYREYIAKDLYKFLEKHLSQS